MSKKFEDNRPVGSSTKANLWGVNHEVKEKLEDMKLWRHIKKTLFREIHETYYLATPYLQLARQERGWTLEEMSKRAKVNKNFYHDFERGLKRAKLPFIIKIQNALNKGKTR